MKKGLIIASVCAIAVGIVIVVAIFASTGFSFEKLSGTNYVENTYTAFGEFESIDIHAVTEDITFKPAEDGKLRVVCLEPEKVKHTVTVEGGTLMIRIEDERSWTDRITLFGKTPKTTVYLPAAEYAAISVENTTGDITLPKDFSFDSLNLKTTTGDIDCAAAVSANAVLRATTGDIRLSEASCGSVEFSVTTGHIDILNTLVTRAVSMQFGTGDVTIDRLRAMSLHAEGGTGDITLKNSVMEGDMDIKVGTGDVRFESSDAGELRVTTTTGSVKGTLLTPKVFITNTGTGSVDVPKTAEGGRCEITTSTGSIRIGIAE